MTDFVAHNVVHCKPRAVNHLRTVPEGIGAEGVTVVHGGGQGQPGVVQAVAAVFVKIEIIGVTGEKMGVTSFAVPGHAAGVALVTDQRAGQAVGVIGSVGFAVLYLLDQVDVQGDASGSCIDEKQLAYAVRFLLVGYLDAPGKARIAVPGFQHFGIDDPQLRHAGPQRSFLHVVPLSYCFQCQPARLARIDVGPGINIEVAADLSAHGDYPAVFIQVHQQLAGKNGYSFVKLAVTMAGAATGFGFFTSWPRLLFRAGESEHRAEVFDGRHGGDIRRGCFIY